MGFDAWEILIRLVSGMVIGFFIALTGVGGGALTVPAMTIILGLPSSIAVGTASLYAFLAKAYAVFEHYRMGTLDRSAALTFLVGAIPGNVVTAYLINSYIRNAGAADAARLEDFQESLGLVIALSMLLSAIILSVNLVRKTSIPKAGAARTGSARETGRTLLCVLFGLIVGGLVGATSVGGGILVLPVLIVLFGLSAARAVGTSILIAFVLSLQTSVIFMWGGQLELITAVVMWVGSLAGVFAGSRLAVRMPERPLQAIVISVIFIASIVMLVKAG